MKVCRLQERPARGRCLRLFTASIALACATLSAVASAQGTAPEHNAPLPGEVLAGLADLNFDVMGAKQGLPHDSVYGFAQDTRGFLWIATFGGLSRYDGYHLRNFVHDTQDPASIPDNNIRVILPAADGGLWIATGNAGVVTYDPANDAFRPLPNLPAPLRHSHIFCMEGDGAGGIWFGSQLGLVHYAAKTQTYELFGKAAGGGQTESGFTLGNVFSVLQDSHGDLWVGGDHGLLVRHAGATHFEPVLGLDGDGQIGRSPAVWTLFEDHEGRLWVGTDKSGAGIVNRATGRIEGVAGLAGASSLTGTATVRGIVEVHRNRFWIATYGSGLVTFDMDSMHGHRYVRDLTAAAPLSNNFMRSIFMDSSGLVWLGTDRGLSRVNSSADGLLTIHSSPLRTNGLEGNEVRSVGAQGDRLWVGFDQGGIAVIEPDGRIRNVSPGPGVKTEDRSQREILAIKAADAKTVYAGGQGLYEVDTQRLTYRPVPGPLLARQIINALLVDGDDVWAATYNGLVRYNRATHSAQLYAHNVNDASSLADNYVRDLVKTSDGQLWITTRLGLDRMDVTTGKFAHIRHDPHVADSLPSDNIQPIAEDLKGRLWIGTIGDGIAVLMNRDTDGRAHFRTLRHADGFPNDIVLTVMRGIDGRIWSNTPGGLAVIDPDTFRMRTYTAADGLRTSSQNLFSSATLRDGTIVFPGDQGLIVVRPGLLQQHMPAPNLVMTDIHIAGQPQSPVASAWRALRDGITLAPAHRAFEASFALLDYSAPDSVRYSYKLEGFDKEWTDPGQDRRTAAYTNLPAGHYSLLIRAVDRDGAGPSAEIAIPVTALAAWNEQNWFRLLAVLMIVGLVLLATRLRTEMIQKRKEELEHEVAVRTAELAANQTELVKANQQLAELATRDPLTGVFNRRQFIANAESELQRTRRTGSPFTLLLMDADHFKSINDRFGHMAGDEVLKSLVLQIAGQLRRNDLLARYGGEELVVLLVDTTLEEGLVMAERLRDHVEASLVLFDGANIRVTVSIGAAEASREEGLDELLMRADTALYEAKSQGRNRVVAAGADPSHRSA